MELPTVKQYEAMLREYAELQDQIEFLLGIKTQMECVFEGIEDWPSDLPKIDEDRDPGEGVQTRIPRDSGARANDQAIQGLFPAVSGSH
jgi:hypothetical protein